MNSAPRTLLYDIETSLQLAAIFQLKNNDWINPNFLVQERHIISVCYKWLDEDKVHSLSLLDDPKRFAKNPHDDKYVVEAFHKVMSTADCLVGHNSDQFDVKYLKTRMLAQGLDPLPPIPSVDTYKVAKSQFLFNSCRLDYLGKYLGFGGKKHTPPDLWMDVLKGDPKAIKIMVEYNKRDVLLLESVFKKLMPYIPNYMNRQLFGYDGCPRCGSKKIQSRGVHRAITKVYQRYQCQSCAGWFRELKSSSTSTPSRIL